MRKFVLTLAALLPILLSCDRSVDGSDTAAPEPGVQLVPRLVLAPGMDSATYASAETVYVELFTGPSRDELMLNTRKVELFRTHQVDFPNIPVGHAFRLDFRGVSGQMTVWTGSTEGTAGAGGTTTASGVDRQAVSIFVGAASLALPALAIDGIGLPSFRPEIRTYTIGPLPASQSAIVIEALPLDTQKYGVSCSPGSCKSVPLSDTLTTVRILVQGSSLGDTLSYMLNVRRSLPPVEPTVDTTLLDLQVRDSLGRDSIALVPEFKPAVKSYATDDSLPAAATSVRVSATVRDSSRQSVTCNGQACGKVALTGPATTVAIEVLSGGKVGSYSLEIRRHAMAPAPEPRDTTLAELRVADSKGTTYLLQQGFAASTLKYATRDSLPDTTTEVTLFARPSDASRAIVTRDGGIACPSGICQAVPLRGDSTRIRIVVRNDDDSLEYTLDIRRQGRSIPRVSPLQRLAVRELASKSYLTLTPALDSTVFTYSTSPAVPWATTHVAVEAEPGPTGGAVACSPGPCSEIQLTNGPMQITIDVTSAGREARRYLLQIEHAPPPPDSTLDSLYLVVGNTKFLLTPGFSPDIMVYASADSLPFQTAAARVVAKAKDPTNAVVTCSADPTCTAVPLSGPTTPVTITVDARGHKSVYRVNVLRQTAWHSYAWDFETAPGGKSDSIEGGGTIVSTGSTLDFHRDASGTMNGSAGEAVMRWTLRESPGAGGYDEWAVAQLALNGSGIDPRAVRYLEFQAQAKFPSGITGVVRVELSHPDPECNGSGGRLSGTLAFPPAGGSKSFSFDLLNMTYPSWVSSSCQSYTLDQVLRSLKTVDFVVVPEFGNGGSLLPDPQSGELRIDDVRIR